MTTSPSTSRMLTTLVAFLLAIGGWQLGEGLWIYAKARLAQELLQRAWTRTLAGETHAKPWPWADTWPMARLTVPRLGIDQIVLEGAYGRTLAFGPGHMESEQAIGEAGAVILTGHRDTHFSFVRRLGRGDTLVIETVTGRSLRYRVTDTRVIDSRVAAAGIDTRMPMLTLVTCYPFDAVAAGGPLRYVVTAEPATVPVRGRDASADTESAARPE